MSSSTQPRRLSQLSASLPEFQPSRTYQSMGTQATRRKKTPLWRRLFGRKRPRRFLSVARCRMAALSIVLTPLIVIALLSTLLLWNSVGWQDGRWVGWERGEWALIFLGVALAVALLLDIVEVRRLVCPSCYSPFLSSLGCSKHPNARKIAGMTKLGTAYDVLFNVSGCRCPYCNHDIFSSRKSGRASAEHELSLMLQGGLARRDPFERFEVRVVNQRSD
ncbi:MAG: hypothetical protein HKN82_11860 [Akkermansiaceae bacterium]|nr:hypothetical protein [Akkermansiaceae bacterium]NNM31392.1 hypothetical protein [Akkermansiaceae bacterium]